MRLRQRRTDARPQKEAFLRPFLALIRSLGLRGRSIGLLLTAVLSAAKDLGGVFTLAYATDVVLQGGDVPRAIAFMFIVMLLGVLTAGLERGLRSDFHLKSRQALLERFNAKVLRLELSARNLHEIPGAMTLYGEDIPSITDWFERTLPAAMTLAAYSLGALIYSALHSLSLTLLVLPAGVLMMPLLSRSTKKLSRPVAAERRRADESFSLIREVLRDPEWVQANALEAKLSEAVDASLARREEAEALSHRQRAAAVAVSKVLSFLPGLLAAVCGAVYLARGLVTVGFLIAFLQMMMGRFTWIVPQISGFMSQSRSAQVSLNRYQEFLARTEDVGGGYRPGDAVPGYGLEDAEPEPGPERVKREEAEDEEDGVLAAQSEDTAPPIVEIRDLRFAYPGTAEVLHGISLRLALGEKIALVGESGSGKSTVLRLLQGLYREQGAYQGSIKILGRELTECTGAELRALWAPLDQETELFSGTVYENLSMVVEGTGGDPGRIEPLCTELGLGPEILQRKIRRTGTGISGGQSRRIGLARALLKENAVYLLDEPTSALDPKSRDELQELLRTRLAGRSSITVSHHLELIRGADRIYCFKEGLIREAGAHDELMARNGIYAELVRKQALQDQDPRRAAALPSINSNGIEEGDRYA